MKKMMTAVTGLALLMCAPGLLADEHEEPERFTYATYFECYAGKEDMADKAMERNAEVFDQMVDDGDILGWGWLSHHTGGKIRRIRWHQADSLVGVMEAVGTMAEAVAEKFGEDDEMDAGFAKACPKHDDYVYQVTNGMAGSEQGKYSFSVYHKCDIAREERADEIVAEHVAPVMNKMVEEGKLTGWGWQSHVIGGSVRRLQTMGAKDLPTLLAARTASIEAIYGEDDKIGEEFVDICGPHVDYVWNINHAKVAGN